MRKTENEVERIQVRVAEKQDERLVRARRSSQVGNKYINNVTVWVLDVRTLNTDAKYKSGNKPLDKNLDFEKTFNHNLSEPRVRTHTRKQTEEHMQRENNTKYAPDEHQTTWQWHRMRRHLHKQSKTGGHNQVMKRKLCRQLMARLSNWIQWNLQFGCLFVCQNMLSKELLFYK